MMSASIIGAFIGLVLGIADFAILGYVAKSRGERRPADRLGSRFAINAARVSQLILFPIVGWFAGPIVASQL